MATIYKTSQATAQQMAESWYALVPSLENEPPAELASDVNHWTTQIQQDGSNTAFQNFANSIASQHPSLNAGFTAAAAAQTKATGLPPWTPATGAVNGQLPGTNTKSGGAEIGTALTSPVGKIVEGVVAGAIDVLSDGALTPVTTAGLAALQAGGTALQPGNNAGTILSAGLGGAALGGAAGAVSGVVNGVTGIGTSNAPGSTVTSSGSVLPAGVSPLDTQAGQSAAQAAANGDLSNVANAGSATGAPAGTLASASTGLPTTSAVPSATSASTGGLTPQQVAGGASALGASNTSSTPSTASSLTSLLGTNPITATAAAVEAANAANLSNESTNEATGALATDQAAYDAQAPLRAAGIAGMLNPATPAPGLPALSALNTAASKGNPFATAVPLPTSATATPTANATTTAAPTTSASTPALPAPSPVNTVNTAPPTPRPTAPNVSLNTTLPPPSAVPPAAGGGTPSALAY